MGFEIEVDGENEELGEDSFENTSLDAENENDIPETKEGGEGEEHFSVTIEGEPEEETEEELEKKDPNWIKNLRKGFKEQKKRIRELENQVSKKDEVEVVKLNPKPKLNDPDIDYDTEKYDEKLAQWFEDKRKVEHEEKKRQDIVKKQQESFQNKFNSYTESKSKLPVKDFNEVEAEVVSILSKSQQSVIVKIADDPAKLVYALGKNSKILEQLSKIEDLIEFTAFITKLESKLKISIVKTAPPPEKQISGERGRVISNDNKLDQLRKEAERTGDYTKINAYKKSLKK